MVARTVGGGALAALAARLTPRDRWLLRMLHEHSVLTTTHLHRLGWARPLRQVQGRVRVLREHEVLDGFRPLRPYGQGSHPLHLILGPVGAQVLAAEAGVTVAEVGYRGRARALAVAHRLTLAHDIGVTDLVCDLAATPGLELVRWWSARRCSRYFGHHARPDAYLTLTARPHSARTDHPGGDLPRPTRAGDAGTEGLGVGGWWEMFLEYDTGSENLTQLCAKVAGYHTLAEYTGIVTPVGVWFTRAGRESSARRALADALRAQPMPVRVPILTGATSPARGVVAPGAGGRVWLSLQPGTVERVDLATLATPRPHAPPAGPAAAEPGAEFAGVGSDPAGPFPPPHPGPPRGAPVQAGADHGGGP